MAQTPGMSPEDDSAEFGRRMANAIDQLDPQEPVGLLNLIKLRAAADYGPQSNHPPCSGAEAYHRYSQAVSPLLMRSGASVLLNGIGELLGPMDAWDLAFIVRYPNIAAAAALGRDPEYAEILVHRQAAVEDSRLLIMHFSSTGLADIVPLR